MGDYATRVARTSLFRCLRAQEGFDGMQGSTISQLEALILNAADDAGPHLDRITATFWQYTNHDLQHLCNVAETPSSPSTIGRRELDLLELD